MFNPFIRMTRTDDVKVDINANQIGSFFPNTLTVDGQTVETTTIVGPGVSVVVKDSPKAVRGAIRRAFSSDTVSVSESVPETGATTAS